MIKISWYGDGGINEQKSRKAEKQKSIANKGNKQEGKEVENIKVYRRKNLCQYNIKG